MRESELEEAVAADPHRPIEGIVFDLDGVIVDIEQSVHRAWSEAFSAHGCTFGREEWQGLIGTSGSDDPYDWIVERSAVPVVPRDELRAKVSARQAELNERLAPMPGIEEWVAAARSRAIALAVASSSRRSWVEGRLAQVGLLGAFDAVVCAGGDLRPKPWPDVYLAACRSIGVATGRALAIEDSAHGVAAACAAGMVCVAVPNRLTSDTDLSAAHHRVESLAGFRFDDAVSVLFPDAATAPPTREAPRWR